MVWSCTAICCCGWEGGGRERIGRIQCYPPTATRGEVCLVTLNPNQIISLFSPETTLDIPETTSYPLWSTVVLLEIQPRKCLFSTSMRVSNCEIEPKSKPNKVTKFIELYCSEKKTVEEHENEFIYMKNKTNFYVTRCEW